MHELAAPLLYVIQNDIDSYHSIRSSLAAQSEELLSELDRLVPAELFRAEMVEADTYSLFESLMEGQLSDWYRTSQSRHDAASNNSQPWQRPQDSSSGNLLVSNLSNIHDNLLKRHDPHLYARLEKLEIFPQIYGIRWLRLLFGREFPFRETLMLWDAIFADSCPPSLCDQLVVALLMALRDLLLRYEYQDAVQLLMKLPSNLSVIYCTQFALHLKDPIRFPRPSGSAFSCGYSDTNVKSKKLSNLGQAKSKNSNKKRTRQVGSKEEVKISKEMTKSVPYKKYSLHEDINSDFTVLDLHKDTEEEFQDITKKMIHGDHETVVGDKELTKNLMNTVLKLDKLLLKEENLMKKNEIFQCMVTLKTLLSENNDPSCDSSNVNGNNDNFDREKVSLTTSLSISRFLK